MVHNDSSMDIDIDISRGRSASLSANSSRKSLTHSNCSSITYYKRMEDISNKLSWDKQVKLNKNFTLSYATPKVGKNKMANETKD